MSNDVISPLAVGRGALYALLALLPVVLVGAVAESNIDDFETSGWAALAFLALVLCFGYGGWVAGAVDPEAPLTNGSLAGLGAFVMWIPLRVLIWAVRGDQGLFSGDNAVFHPGAILVFVVIAGVAGMVGAVVSARRSTARDEAADDG
ncbi:MAG: hypothetical protein R3A49_00800 [Acidimicrobiia bacterium]